MRADSVIYLIPLTEGRNNIGDAIEVDGIPRKIFAEKKSVRQSEFYQAAATRYKPEIAFDVWSREYKDEPKLRFKEKNYSIIRTFGKGEKTELICSRLVNEDHEDEINEVI